MFLLVRVVLEGSRELVLWETPTASTESVDVCSNIGLSSDPDELSILRGEVEEMLVLCLVPDLVT
jgi:hypothetical protein